MSCQLHAPAALPQENKILLKIMALWDVCNLLDTNVEAKITASETLVRIYHNKRYHIPENHNLHIHRCGNIKSVRFPEFLKRCSLYITQYMCLLK
jgi:hypothetical protein